jgi:putative ABC transport system substrate-binding protein
VAIIKSNDIKPYREVYEGFKEVIEVLVTEYNLVGDMEKGTEIIKSIKNTDTRLILAIGTKAAIVARQGTQNIPIVFVMVSRPEVYGLVHENITGVTLNISSYNQLKELKSIFPWIYKVGIVYNPNISGEIVAKASEETKILGLDLVAYAVNSSKDVPKTLRRMRGSIDVLWMIMDETIVEPRTLKHIMMFTLKNKIPYMGLSIRFVQDGSLLALTSDYHDMGRQAGEMAKKIISGTPLNELPIASPEKYKLVLNLSTAEIIRVDIPQEVISRAEIVYE